MHRFAIFGAGNNGKWLKRFLQNKIIPIKDEYELCYFIDNNKIKGSFVEGVEIISPYDLCKYQDVKIVISSSKIVDDALKQLRDLGVNNQVYYTPDYVYKLRFFEKDDECELPVLVPLEVSKPRLPYLEYPIVNHCNLDCKGCNALANTKQEYFFSIDDYEKDFIRLREIFSGIKYLKVFGGEPLLHPRWIDFVKLSRRYFPDAKLVVHSNGILVPNLTLDELRIMHRLNVGFVFTLYPVTGRLKDTIQTKLEKNDVSYSFTDPVYNFLKVIRRDGGYNKDEIFRHCYKCINLIDGRLSCGIGDLIAELEKKFDVNICDDKYKKERCINIYETQLNGAEINQLLNTASTLCSYCALVGGYYMNNLDNTSSYPWKGGYKKCRLEDYVM